jgi:hypothetical protein
MRKPSGEWYPDELHFRFGGHPDGTWVELEWQKPYLFYRRGPHASAGSTSTRLKPSSAAWTKFWLDLTPTGVWSWAGDYTKTECAEGTSWSLVMSYRSQSIQCRGQNGYPGGAGPNFPLGSAFDLFLQSLQALTGKRY